MNHFFRKIILAAGLVLAIVLYFTGRDEIHDGFRQVIGGWALLILVLIFYALPTFAAYRLRHPNAQAIAVLNLFGGWTVFGWIVAMVWAFKK